MSCAKRIVRCTIITRSGRVFSGENDCATPQEVCPRTGNDDYTKCKTICRQEAHAEIMALRKLQDANETPKGAIAIVTGIDYVCKQCARSLSMAGVTEVIIRG